MNLDYPHIYTAMDGQANCTPITDAGQSERFGHSGKPLNSVDCSQKRRLLEDYVERVQSLAVESELLLQFDKDSDGLHERWQRIEHVRIACEIARLALVNHTNQHKC